MNLRRVAVTGLGIVSPHGNVPRQAFEALCAGRSGIVFDAEHGVVLAPSSVEVVASGMRLKQGGVDRASQFAISAGESALADAGWSSIDAPCSPDRAGIYVGTGFGGTAAVSEACRRFHGGERIPPLSVVSGMANAPAARSRHS